MRAVLQRVHEARVTVDDEMIGAIGPGLLLFLGAGAEDTDADLTYILNKTLNLRIFPDAQGKMNLSLLDTGGQLLVVSQFTLYGDARKGRRPGFTRALEPVAACAMYEDFIARARAQGVEVQTGRFGADMDVSLINHGPVTMLLDSTRQF